MFSMLSLRLLQTFADILQKNAYMCTNQETPTKY